jgi:hypothetical protein
MSKLSKLLLYLLRLSLKGYPDLQPYDNEIKDFFLRRFMSDTVMAIKYPDKEYRQLKGYRMWVTIKFIEAKTKIQKQGEDITSTL